MRPVLALTIVLFAVSVGKPARPEVSIAAAANLTLAFQTIGPEFERATGIHPVFSFGSTAQLARQIENGAPWDVFAAADVEHVASLDQKGLLLAGSRRVYAAGVLALWLPQGRTALLTDLTKPSVRLIALANPDLAPYGLAARETLQHAGIWDKVKPKVVYAENISMAKQYGATGNADAVFTAYSLVLGEKNVLQVPDSLHQPLAQALGIVAASKNPVAAKRFADFVVSGRGHELLLRQGYR